MIVDTSALLAIILDETDGKSCLAAIEHANHPRMSVGSYLELYLRILRDNSPTTRQATEILLQGLNITLEPITEMQVKIAVDAFDRFGKGRKHPAQLNYGDCFSYALAKYMNEPLLFIGNDFSQTDLSWIDLATGKITQNETG